MKFLKENFGESEELNTFVNQANNRFNTYYVVTLNLNDKVSNRYFAYRESAKKYYDTLQSEIIKDPEYYDDADISLKKVTINLEEENLEDNIQTNDAFDYSDEEEIEEV